MRRFVLSLPIVLAALVAHSALALEKPAAEMQPVAVVSFAGYERFVEDIAALGKTAKLPGLPTSLGHFLRRKTGVESLEGLDPARPMGIAVVTDGLAVVPVAFVPVADEKKLLRSLEKLIDKPQPTAEGAAKIGRGSVTGFVRQRGPWLYVAQTEENLRWLPDPIKTLGDLPKQYDAAVQFNWQHVPEVFRTMGIDLVRLAMRNNLARRADETEAAHELRRRWATWQFRIIEQFLRDSRQITLGWTLDERSRQATLDLRLIPEPESGLARQLLALRETKTRFGGLLADDPPLSFQANWSLTTSQAQKLEGDLTACRDPLIRRIGEFSWIKSSAERETFQKVAGGVLDVLLKTVQSSQADVAVAVRFSRDADDKRTGPAKAGDAQLLTVAAAAHVGEGEPLRQAFEAVARLGEQDPRFAGFKRKVARVEGHDVHAVIFDADERQIARRLFGEELKIYVMPAADSLCAAIGPHAIEQLRLSVRPRPAAAPPLKLVVRLGAAADVLERMAGPNYFTPLAAAAAGEDDQVTLTVSSDDAGLSARLVAHKGVLKAAGTAIALALLASEVGF